MRLKKMLVLGMAMVMGMAAASSALASSISIDQLFLNCWGFDLPDRDSFAGADIQQGSSFSYQPTKAGSFTLTGSGGSGSIDYYWTTPHNWDWVIWIQGDSMDGTPAGTGGITGHFYGGFFLPLTQEGPLRFSAISVSATLLVNGTLSGTTETLLYQGAVDANLIETGGQKLIDYPFTIDGGMPLTYLCVGYDPGRGYAYEIQGTGSASFSIDLTVTGTVVDTSAPVPLPSTLLLLGSGLGVLGFFGQRKLLRQS